MFDQLKEAADRATKKSLAAAKAARLLREAASLRLLRIRDVRESRKLAEAYLAAALSSLDDPIRRPAALSALQTLVEAYGDRLTIATGKIR